MLWVAQGCSRTAACLLMVTHPGLSSVCAFACIQSLQWVSHLIESLLSGQSEPATSGGTCQCTAVGCRPAGTTPDTVDADVATVSASSSQGKDINIFLPFLGQDRSALPMASTCSWVPCAGTCSRQGQVLTTSHISTHTQNWHTACQQEMG